MASIQQRGKKFYVIYTYRTEDGTKMQKWEGFSTKAEASARAKQIDYQKENGSFTIPKCVTVSDLLTEYVAVYGKKRWAISTYKSNCALIDHYINPVIGHIKIQDVTPRLLERYYDQLLNTPSVTNEVRKNTGAKFLTVHTVREVHKILNSCFKQAYKWELVPRNPVELAMVPHEEHETREIWTAEELFHAIDLCDDDRLTLALHLAFSCSLRMGEMLGLTWDCVDISEESIASMKASIYVTKELQRVDRATMGELEDKGVVLKFPAAAKSSTLLVLKTPKTASSVRKIFLPTSVARMLQAWKAAQDAMKEMVGEEYTDFNLVFASDLGRPTEASTINKSLHRLIKENNLPPVVFHSLRHSSITYKLKLNGGDIKAVQGDSGHSQVKMVADVYSHILDDSRVENARLFEENFYSGRNNTSETVPASTPAATEGIDPSTLAKLLSNPEMAAVLKLLTKNL